MTLYAFVKDDNTLSHTIETNGVAPVGAINVDVEGETWVAGPDRSVEIASHFAREERNSLLKETDYSANSDVTMTTEMTAYRQALRDITSQSGWPTTITWPTKT